MKQNHFPQQTHFIGVLLPEDITLTLEDCRRYMHGTYGCKSGHGTPIHVTLVPPFRLPEPYRTADIVRALADGPAAAGLAFTARIEQFDAFGDRTLFARVIADARWEALRDAAVTALLQACPGCTGKDRRPFQPHATVANRDIPPGAVTAALAVMNELHLSEAFPVSSITVFERKDGSWKAAVTLDMT